MSLTQSEITNDVSATGLWRKRSQTDSLSQSMRVDVAFLVSDSWQTGISSSIANGRGQWGLGDTQAVTAYEFLPELDFSVWKPKGLWFFKLTFPTGNSIYDDGYTNLMGRGFWTPASGLLFTKIIGSWDFSLAGEIHKSLDRKSGATLIVPGWGTIASLDFGYSYRSVRLAFAISSAYEEPIATSNDRGNEQAFAEGSLKLNYSVTDNYILSLAYSDQTWFGNPMNTALSRAVNVNLAKTWPR